MFNTSLSDGNALAALSGQLTFTDHGAFRDMARHLVASKAGRLTIDFGGVEFIDSAGLGMLLLLREEAGATGRPVVLRNAQGQVKRMFAVSRFDTLFVVEP
ncbi:MAG TPA: STAS domain-containing protein [Candidatus Sulfotelmatobacter sp.]|nr:STAS domain-containing protein [Candidatus Sulfotelmatobacter sp.]